MDSNKNTVRYQITRLIPLLFLIPFFGFSQNETLHLWPGKVPNQKTSNEKEKHEEKDILLVSNVQDPEIEVYLPNKRSATGEAVVIFPGGGYYVLAYDWEGRDVAKFLNAQGIAGIVVKYRLPISASLIEPYKAPLQDAQRAMRMVRANAEKWNLDPAKIGAMGFSAGGHLASTLGTQYDIPVYDAVDDMDKLSARPDFLALIYPVISFGPEGHAGSKGALLGKDPSEAMVKRFSNELNITVDTPPTFLVHASDDGAVPVKNSLLFYNGLLKNNVPAAMHIFPHGGHGFAMGVGNPQLNEWTHLFTNWLTALDNKK